MSTKTDTFTVEVPNEGKFVFRRRNLKLGFAVMAEDPAGFVLDELDVDDDASYRRLAAVAMALAEKEADLKGKPVKALALEAAQPAASAEVTPAVAG